MRLSEKIHDEVEEALNSEGRSLRHVLAGAAVCLGAVGLSTLVAAYRTPGGVNRAVERQYDRLDEPAVAPPKKAVSLLWPALFSVTTLAALRIWNAPPSRERTRALWMWTGLQVLNTAWMALGPRRRAEQLVAALSTAGLTAAYAGAARKVDEVAAGLVAPYAGWVSFANLFTGELWRKNLGRPDGATVH
ncbi:MAG: tryptophan-rich sensory protein [Caulobacteraceae bacterium]|nr:tryptophan-rich sensory protein [Caulobacteraceae bacterium]